MEVAVKADLTMLRETHDVCPRSLNHQRSMALRVDHATSFILPTAMHPISVPKQSSPDTIHELLQHRKRSTTIVKYC